VPHPSGSEAVQISFPADLSLHAGVSAEAHQRDKLERLCRYICRPAVSEKRLALTSNGNIRYQLKTPYRDGTTHVIFEPLDFIAKLAALVPKPRVNLTRLDEERPCSSPYRQPSVVQIHSR
jgi:hypothetical protein